MSKATGQSVQQCKYRHASRVCYLQLLALQLARGVRSILYRIRRAVYIHTPLRWFSELDFSTSKRVLIPNDTYSESSRRDDSNTELYGTDTIPTAEISTMEKSAQRV